MLALKKEEKNYLSSIENLFSDVPGIIRVKPLDEEDMIYDPGVDKVKIHYSLGLEREVITARLYPGKMELRAAGQVPNCIVAEMIVRFSGAQYRRHGRVHEWIGQEISDYFL